ncbi:hypothetical protein V1Y59_22515 [Gordonia sp. PKS22-38]|uniref:Transcriptional regulator, AbiEi antitoxin, Type IV TA system n=1 Tax=Gordonia prachuapensis TaxID=3115651 RepID=A0ABU7MZW7_9ACTN|nr:hypothetical protein [Gordonia sp. PKS22-38]
MDDLFRIEHAVTRLELLARGHTAYDIRMALQAGHLITLSRGVLISPTFLDESREQRHREIAAARLRSTAIPHRALAGVSAAATLGLPIWGLDAQKVVMVDASRPPGTRSSTVTRIVTDGRPPALTVFEGVPVTSPARTVIDIARCSSRIPAIAVGDAALHAGLCTVTDLENELDLIAKMTGAERARLVVSQLNGLSESVLESRSRIELTDRGLPMPELQVNLYDAWGRWIARVDFYWRELQTVGEADGESKYHGENGVAVLRREKGRSDALTESGARPVHWGWSDVDDADGLVKRIRRVMAHAAA